MIVVVVTVTVALIATCFHHRQILHVKSTTDTENNQNLVYEGDTRQDRELPQMPQTDGEYEQPAEYAQLVSSKRVHIHANHQSLIVRG